jgi:hypothetical protein
MVQTFSRVSDKEIEQFNKHMLRLSQLNDVHRKFMLGLLVGD